MIKGIVTVLSRDDLHYGNRNIDFDEIDYYHFIIDKRLISQEEMIIFVEIDGNTKILKNRWGNNGAIETKSKFKKMLSRWNINLK